MEISQLASLELTFSCSASAHMLKCCNYHAGLLFFFKLYFCFQMCRVTGWLLIIRCAKSCSNNDISPAMRIVQTC